MKNKKILMLALVGGIVYSTTSNVFIKTNAILTAPSSYDYYYAPYYDGGFVDWRIGMGSVGSGTSTFDYIRDPLYSRQANSSYYDYFYADDYPINWPTGLDVDMKFVRSNVGNWVQYGSSSFYYPEFDVIGSDNSVGSVADKVYLQYTNNTNSNYLLYVDFSSTAAAAPFLLQIDTNGSQFYITPTILNVFTIFANSKIEIRFFTNAGARYLNAWYLKDLGLSASYEAGYDDGLIDGYDDGFDDGVDVGQTNAVLSGGIGSIFTSAFTGIAGVFNIQAFGEITLGQLALAPIALGLLFILLNLVSGQISYNAGVTEAKRNQGRRDSRYRR